MHLYNKSRFQIVVARGAGLGGCGRRATLDVQAAAAGRSEVLLVRTPDHFWQCAFATGRARSERLELYMIRPRRGVAAQFQPLNARRPARPSHMHGGDMIE